jgi:hypothetical protein
MTGVQLLSSESIVNAMPAPSEAHLSDEWTDSVVLRAIVSAIPRDQRMTALAALRAMVHFSGNDTVAGH